MSEYGSAPVAAMISSHVGDRPSARGFNAVGVLTVYIFLLFFIPYDVEFAPLGGSGTPSTMFAATLIIAYLVLWLEARTSSIPESQPVRTAMLVFGCAFVASYISANRHTMIALDQNGADRGLISLMGWLGVVFVAADGIDTMAKLKILIHRVVLGVGTMAIIGISQFFLKFDITKFITIPGFANVIAYADVSQRSGLTRPASTTATPLELVAVLAMILPLAIHRARYAPPDRARHRWLLVATIGAALPMTISRTAILVLLVIAVVMLPTWPRRERRAAYLAIPVALGAGFITIPGMLGTFAGILSNNGAVTASTQSRTNAYSSAVPLIEQHPWFGSGFGTFPPQTYFFTDNQYLNSTIVMGFVGMLALVGLFVTGWITARKTRRLSTDQETRDLAQALAGSIAAAAAAFATFDALSFDIATGLTFLVLGCIGCLWRLVRINEDGHLG
jgi:O-antigen ligase/polysaccharide polymerase Wzy-like membrane protein